MKKTNNISGWW